MNQQILFNDDLCFMPEKNYWQWSAIVSGENIAIVVKSVITPDTFTVNHQFDWELAIEEWLENNDIDNNQLTISLK